KLQRVQLLHILLHFIRQPAEIARSKIAELLFHVVEPFLRERPLIRKKLRGAYRFLGAVLDIFRNEARHQFLADSLGHNPVRIRKANLKYSRRSAPAHLVIFHRADFDILGAHLLDHVVERHPAALLRIKLHRRDDVGKRGPAENHLRHGVHPALHVQVDIGWNQALRNLRRNNPYAGRRDVRIRPKESDHDGGDQARKHRTKDPSPVAADDVDVILDIERSAVNDNGRLCLHDEWSYGARESRYDDVISVFEVNVLFHLFTPAHILVIEPEGRGAAKNANLLHVGPIAESARVTQRLQDGSGGNQLIFASAIHLPIDKI